MGACQSDVEQPQEQPTQAPRTTSGGPGPAAHLEVESPQRYDREEVDLLKTALEDTPEIFVLNNMLMSIMFYENYQRNNTKLMHTSSTRMEKELNPILLRTGTKNCIAPDAVFEEANRNVCLRPTPNHPDASQQLVPRRLYVVNGDIEVFDSMDVPQYSEIDKPSYRATMQDSERKGYVKLRLIEKIPRAVPVSSLENPQPGCSSAPEEIYDYATIQELRTPKPIATCVANGDKDKPRDRPEDGRRDTLPEECFCTQRLRKQAHQLDLDPDNINRLNEDSFYETVSYIRSKGFMQHFQSNIFPGPLATSLGFNEKEVAAATAVPGIIFCHLHEPGRTRVECEIIPSVAMSWPAKQTFDFERRSRPIITDRRRGIRYQWPTSQMIEEIVNMNHSVVIPTGYVRKRQPAKNSAVVDSGELEWEVCFPKAERYVETRMTHAQARCLLFLATLQRTLVEPETRGHGLQLEHIRRHLYWECEDNYRDWPEHRLGTKLLLVLQNLCQALARANLPDYFVKHKNVLENVPKKFLWHAQGVFHEVQQAPVMYFIKALRNLKYRNENKFYPMPDFMELYKILTTDGAVYVNPSLIPDSNVPTRYKSKKYGLDSDHVLTRIQMQNRKKRLEEQKKDDMNLNKRKDSIELQWTCEKKFDKFKTRSILCFFIKQFIGIASASSKFRALEQGLFYLKQAWYLTKVLEHNEVYKPDAIEFQEQIAELEDILMADSTNTTEDPIPPSTPTRKSLPPFDNAEQDNTKHNNNNLSPHKFRPNRAKKVPSGAKTKSVNRSVSFIEDNVPKSEVDNPPSPAGKENPKQKGHISKKPTTPDSPTEKITFITSF